MRNADCQNLQPMYSEKWQSSVDCFIWREKWLTHSPRAFWFFCLQCHLEGVKASSVVLVYKADLEGHKGTIKLVEELGDNYLFELLAISLIHNSQFYFTCVWVCIFNLLCHPIRDLMYYLGRDLNKMKLHRQMHL